MYAGSGRHRPRAQSNESCLLSGGLAFAWAAVSMNPPFGARIRALLAQRDRPLSDLRIVMLANGWTALAGASAVCLGLSLPLAWVAALAPLLFLGFSACLLFKYAFWGPAVVVGLAHAAAGVLLVAYWAARLPPALRWPGGVIGFAIPFVAIVRMYGQVARRARQWERVGS